MTFRTLRPLRAIASVTPIRHGLPAELLELKQSGTRDRGSFSSALNVHEGPTKKMEKKKNQRLSPLSLACHNSDWLRFPERLRGTGSGRTSEQRLPGSPDSVGPRFSRSLFLRFRAKAWEFLLIFRLLVAVVVVRTPYAILSTPPGVSVIITFHSIAHGGNGVVTA